MAFLALAFHLISSSWLKFLSVGLWLDCIGLYWTEACLVYEFFDEFNFPAPAKVQETHKFYSVFTCVTSQEIPINICSKLTF